MQFSQFSLNGEMLPIQQAVIPFDSVEAMYGFGVYETIKVRNNDIYFLKEHIKRLFHSATCIGLSHSFTEDKLTQYIVTFVENAVETDSCNLKLLLMGGAQPDFYIFASSPYYPDRKWYKEGVRVVSFVYERWMPQAKTLNMLPSYYFYTKAKEAGCYDALLVDSKGYLREGTRTNVYLLKGRVIVSPPKKNILEGVTMMTLEKVIQNTDFTIQYTDIPFEDSETYDGMFLTSTSTKILPIKKVNEFEYPSISEPLHELIRIYNEALDTSGGDFEKL